MGNAEYMGSQVEKECKTLSISDLKRHEFPIARIKKIMKLDEDVEKISVEAPFLLEKACELLVMELTMRSQTLNVRRATMTKNDISYAVNSYDQFDFLIDIVPEPSIKVKYGGKTVDRKEGF